MKRLLIFVVLVAVAQAQNLDELIKTTLQNNTAIRSAKTQVELSKQKKELATLVSKGKFEAVATYNKYNTPRTLAPTIPSGMGSVATSKDIYTFGLTYNVKLFSGFEISSEIDIQKFNKIQSEAKLNLTKEQIIYNTKSLYLSILANNELLKAWQENTKALQKLTSLIEYEVSLGKKSNLDLIKAKVDLTNSKISEDNLVSNIKSLKATLSNLAGAEVDDVVPLKFDVEKFVANKYEISNLNKIKISNIEMQKVSKEIKKAKSKNYPQVYLSANYLKNYDNNLANDEQLSQITLNLKWDIFDFGQSKKEIELNKIKRQIAMIQKEDTKQTLKKDIKVAINDINLNYKKYNSNKIQVKLAKQTYEIEQTRYKSDASTLNDLLLAKAKEQLAISKLIQAKYDYLKSRFYLEYLLESGSKE